MIPEHVRRLALEYMAERQDTVLRPKLNDLFMTWRKFNGRYFDGYPCPPCPNCGDEIMWYREYTWRYGPDGKFEHGKRCERCEHHWSDETGEVWRQGKTRAEVRELWRGDYEPPDHDDDPDDLIEDDDDVYPEAT